MGKQIDHIPQDILATFTSYSWPGNVRELQNLVERAVIRSNNGVLANPLVVSEKLSDPPVPPQSTFSDSQRASQRALILQALQETGWVIGGSGGAAARLGLKRTTLIAKMKKFGISRPMPSDNRDELTDGLQREPAPSCG
jgi:transcriptional regulator with GAF, ATPase, and Fis domain